MSNHIIPPPHWRATIEAYLDNGLGNEAIKQLEKWNLQYEIVDGKLVDKKNSTEYWLSKFITVNPQMMVMKDHVRKIAKVDDCVLIVGPTGCGKELIAHALIGERDQFVAVNSAGIPENLIESILFGHVKGAFTGAVSENKGMCVQAGDGILFLDEIGDMALHLQAKILRAIQEKKILPVGANREVDIRCRFVSATHRNLTEMVRAERFREDLYARISTFEINISGFASRNKDIIPIVQSIPGGNDYLNAVQSHLATFDKSECEEENISVEDYINSYGMCGLGVRGLQRAVRRFQVLGEI